jgi:site-specific DNA-adenine methylase
LSLIDDMQFDLKRVVIGDASPHIAAFWRWVIQDPAALSARYDDLFKPFDSVLEGFGTHRAAFLDLTWFSSVPEDDPERKSRRFMRTDTARRELYELYQQLRDTDGDELTQAARITLLHNLAYSGISATGGISYTRTAKTRLGGKLELFSRASLLLRSAKAEVVCGDFVDTCERVRSDPSAFIYCDPPYATQSYTLYEHGLANGVFSHERLADYLCGLSGSISFLVSYDDSAYIRSLYTGKPGVKVEAYKLSGGYLSTKASAAALEGEELFISSRCNTPASAMGI